MENKNSKQEIIAFIKASSSETNIKLAAHIKHMKALKEAGKAKVAQ